MGEGRRGRPPLSCVLAMPWAIMRVNDDGRAEFYRRHWTGYRRVDTWEPSVKDATKWTLDPKMAEQELKAIEYGDTSLDEYTYLVVLCA